MEHPLPSAEQARNMYQEDTYAQNMVAVTEAILAAAPGSHRTTLDIPTGVNQEGFCASYLVSERLRDKGFDVIIIHDPDNGSSELTIDWSKKSGIYV